MNMLTHANTVIISLFMEAKNIHIQSKCDGNIHIYNRAVILFKGVFMNPKFAKVGDVENKIWRRQKGNNEEYNLQKGFLSMFCSVNTSNTVKVDKFSVWSRHLDNLRNSFDNFTVFYTREENMPCVEESQFTIAISR